MNRCGNGVAQSEAKEKDLQLGLLQQKCATRSEEVRGCARVQLLCAEARSQLATLRAEKDARIRSLEEHTLDIERTLHEHATQLAETEEVGLTVCDNVLSSRTAFFQNLNSLQNRATFQRQEWETEGLRMREQLTALERELDSERHKSSSLTLKLTELEVCV